MGALKKQVYQKWVFVGLLAAALFFCIFYSFRIHALTAERAKAQLFEAASISAGGLSHTNTAAIPASYGLALYGGDGWSAVVDSSGRLLASSRKELAGKNFLTLLENEARSDAPAPVLADLKARRSNVTRCLFEGESVYLALVPVPGSTQLYSIAAAPVWAVRARAFAVLRVSFFCCLFLLAALAAAVIYGISKRERRHRLILRQALGSPAVAPQPYLARLAFGRGFLENKKQTNSADENPAMDAQKDATREQPAFSPSSGAPAKAGAPAKSKRDTGKAPITASAPFAPDIPPLEPEKNASPPPQAGKQTQSAADGSPFEEELSKKAAPALSPAVSLKKPNAPKTITALTGALPDLAASKATPAKAVGSAALAPPHPTAPVVWRNLPTGQIGPSPAARSVGASPVSPYHAPKTPNRQPPYSGPGAPKKTAPQARPYPRAAAPSAKQPYPKSSAPTKK